MKLNTLFVYIKDPRRTIKVLILRYGAGKEVRNDKKLKRAALHTAYKAQQDYLDRIHAEHLQEAAIREKQARSTVKAHKLAAMMKLSPKTEPVALPHFQPYVATASTTHTKPAIGQDMVRRPASPARPFRKPTVVDVIPSKQTGPKPLGQKNLIQ